MSYYSIGGSEYNLDHVVKIKHLKDICKFGYFQAHEDVEEFGWFKKWVFGPRARTKGSYYSYGFLDDPVEEVSKERATYSGEWIRVWFVNDPYEGREWEMQSEESALNLIELCKNNKVCKYEISQPKT